MTAIYIVAAWVGVQIASEAFPAFNIPESAIRYVWFAALFDQQPPMMADAVWTNNTDTLVYDVFGRSYFLSLSLEF